MTSTPPTDSAPFGADDAVCAQLDAVRALLRGLPERLVGVASGELAELAASAAGVVAAAEAARAAVVLEAHSRGVINASDHPRTRDWVEQSCKEAGVPVVKAQARQLQDITTDCDGHDLAALRQAVTEGRVPMDAAANVAKVFRKLKKKTNYNAWDELLQILIDWAASAEDQRELAAIEDWCLSQYGTEEALDDEHATLYEQRTVTPFRRDRTGMLSATVKFDPASEAAFTAAIHALSKPQPDPDGTLDPRSAGQRRADALLTMARLSTRPDKDIPGSGAAARVTVTISLTALMAGLDLGDRLGKYATRAYTGHTTTSSGGSVDTGYGKSGDCRCSHSIDTRTHANASAGIDGSADAETDASGCSCAHADGSHDPERARHGVAGYGQILSAREARMLACDAEIIPAVLGTGGQILDFGRSKRLITPGLRDYLHARDKGCTYPGCSAPPSWCEGHHIIHWSRGGPTDRSNLALLCRHHHTVVHRHDHTATVDEFGVHWTRFDGTPIGNSARGVWIDVA